MIVLGVSFFTSLPQVFTDFALIFVILVGVVFYFVFNKFVRVARLLINKYLGKIIK
jgi:hypothetical protein